MSTFDGIIKEFPDIQVDYFRAPRGAAARRPLACFLSHVHSDHLVGLDSLRSPLYDPSIVYCSAATRALVLRLETYACRANFARGLVEARKRTYRGLQHLLKPLPLEAPAVIELAPGNEIQVTLLDANHCPGSVMFLFESEQTAVLYTGDTRLEPWFVNALVQSPCLAEYTSGLRTLATVYLDTTFVDTAVAFQTKAEGLQALLQAVARYPADTVFYFRAWTFGYERVWAALAKALRSKVHVDAYRMGLYASLTAKDAERRFGTQVHLDPSAPGLVGFMRGNAAHDGCLVAGAAGGAAARIHSCEKGVGACAAVRDAPVVWIRPVVCRLPNAGGAWPEAGAGGGGADLNPDAELEVGDAADIGRLGQLVAANKTLSDAAKADVQALLAQSLHGHRPIPIPADVGVDSQGSDDSVYEPLGGKTLDDVVCDLARLRGHGDDGPDHDHGHDNDHDKRPQTITFPYARHSSYEEQCDLLSKLRPRDVWPCTVNQGQWFGNGKAIVTIEALFGHCCSGRVFRHDVEVAAQHQRRGLPDGATDGREILDSQATTRSDAGEASDESPAAAPPAVAADRRLAEYPYFYHAASPGPCHVDEPSQGSQATTASDLSREQRRSAQHAAIHNALGRGEWLHIDLASTTDSHTRAEPDLGG